MLLVMIVFNSFVFSQFPSSSASKISMTVPKAQNIGDTVYTIVPNGQRSEGYRLVKIRKDGYYVYDRLMGYATKSIVIIKYNEQEEITSYSSEYKIKGMEGGEGHGYTEIDYYPNGNIHYYLLIGKKSGTFYKYDSLNYVEKNRSKISHKELICFKILGKWYLVNSEINKSDEKKLLYRHGFFFRKRFLNKNKDNILQFQLEDSSW